jgi:hypothetical protein
MSHRKITWQKNDTVISEEYIYGEEKVLLFMIY